MNNTIGIGLTTLLIFSTFLVLVVGLAGCASDGYQSSNRNDGSGESWQDRAFKPKGGGGRQFGPDDILSGGPG